MIQHIPADCGFSLLHWLKVGGGDAPENTVIMSQRLVEKRMLANVHRQTLI